MMTLMNQCGFVKRSNRLRAMSKLLGRQVDTFTSLTQQEVDEATEKLTTWRMLQHERFVDGILMEESLAYVGLLCDDSRLTLSDDDDVLPTEKSRKRLRTFIMSNREKFAPVDEDAFNKKLSAITNSRGSSIDDVKLDAKGGRLPLDEVIPAPTVSLGLELGVGGFPLGSITHIYGEKHSGKTLLSSHVIAEAQQSGIPTVLLDAEAAADGAFLASAGVDLDKLHILRPHDLETLCQALRDLADSGALIVVDSIAAAESSKELERNLSKDAPRVGGNALLWKSTLNLFRPVAKKYGTTLILINQIRSKIGGMPNTDPHKPYGSEAIQHNSDISIRVSSVREKKDTLSKNGYKMSRFNFKKNRNSGQLGRVDVTFKPGRAYDRSIDVVRSCSMPIEDGSDTTYGKLSYGALLSDTVYNDQNGEFEPRQNRFAITIDPYMMAAILKDEPDFDEVDIEPVEEYDGLWDADNPAPDISPDLPSSGMTLPGVGEINAMKWMKKHPYARDLIIERLLNGLNRKDDFIQEFA